MPAARSRASIGLCLLFSCGAERASHARRGRVRMCCVQFYVSLHGHQQACVARVQFVTLHYIFENVMFSSLVCNLFSSYRLFHLVHKTNFADHVTKDEVTEIQR